MLRWTSLPYKFSVFTCVSVTAIRHISKLRRTQSYFAGSDVRVKCFGIRCSYGRVDFHQHRAGFKAHKLTNVSIAALVFVRLRITSVHARKEEESRLYHSKSILYLSNLKGRTATSRAKKPDFAALRASDWYVQSQSCGKYKISRLVRVIRMRSSLTISLNRFYRLKYVPILSNPALEAIVSTDILLFVAVCPRSIMT